MATKINEKWKILWFLAADIAELETNVQKRKMKKKCKRDLPKER